MSLLKNIFLILMSVVMVAVALPLLALVGALIPYALIGAFVLIIVVAGIKELNEEERE